jgi:bile acid-coenzyme A ligase
VTGRLDLLGRIRQVAGQRGDAAAFVFADHRGAARTVGWAQLAEDVSGLAASIRRHTGPDGVVTVPAHGSPEAVAACLAVLAAGRALFPLDPRSPADTRERLADQVRRLGGTVVGHESLTAAPDEPAGAEADPGADQGPDPDAGHRPGGFEPGGFGSGGYILASGGSTGFPKPIHRPGAPVYHPRVVPSALLRRTGWREGQVQLLAGPLHHAAPFTRFVDGVLSGNTMVIPQIFRADLILGLIEQYQIEWMQLTPSTMGLLDDALGRQPEAFAPVRGVLHTAAPCPADTKRRWIGALGGDRVFEMYASTENLGTTLCDGDEWLAHPGTVGRGFFTRLRILDAAGAQLPPGQVGDVYMRSVQSSRAASGGTRPARDGYESVGDRGHVDEDGYLFLSGRREDLVIVGGENVYVSEVTAALLACPGIADAAVTGQPDPLLGARLCALVVTAPADPPSVRDVLDHCLSRLAPYKVPAEVRFVAALPRTAAGKLDRSRLPALLEA